MASSTKQLVKVPAITRAEIRAFVKDVVEKFHPSKVILFGSYAYGTPNPDSDVDLLVIMRHRETGPQVATRIRLACPREFSMDLMVRSPIEVRRQLQMRDSLMCEIIDKGIVLHETNDA